MSWKIARDVAIIIALTFLGGFVIGLAGPSDPGRFALAIAVSNILFMTAGFTLSGALAKTDRFKHLLKVALGVWLFSLVNILLGISNLVQWAFALIFILLAMGLGGGLSFAFVRVPKASGI